MRRIPDRCYLCGDPTASEWFCAAHLWAAGTELSSEVANGIEHITKDHAFWIERFTPQQIVELAGYVQPNGAVA